MARPKKDPADDKSERAADFIDIAAQHMAERGYDRTTVRDIAADMGLTSGSIFYHFRNKEELLEAIIRKGIVEGLAFTRTAMAQDMGPLMRFHTLVRAHLRLVHSETRYVHRVWTSEWSKLSQEAHERLRMFNDEYTKVWSEILSQLHDAGQLHADPVLVRHILLPGLNWTSKWVRSLSEADEIRLADQVCSTVLNCSVERCKQLRQDEQRRKRR